MLTLGFLTFLVPTVLIAGAALPLVWLLLRLTPPAVRRLDFPAARLLFNLERTERTPARTPPWVLLLRIGMLALVVLGLADPVLTANRGGNDGPLLLVVDDGWASANQWDKRVKALRNLLERVDRYQQDVALITTAPTATPPAPPRFMPAREALARVTELTPRPWPVDRGHAAAEISALKIGANTTAIWISDGVASTGDDALMAALQHLNRVDVIADDSVNTPMVLSPPERSADPKNADRIAVTLRRVGEDTIPAVARDVRAVDSQGEVLAQTLLSFDAGAHSATGAIDLPAELANRIARFDVQGHASAATTVLADGRWQRRPVGLASETANGIAAPLLEDAYYIRQALEPFADLRSGTLDTLLARPLSVLIMASGGKILDTEYERVDTWVEHGGVLVRFAGPRLDNNVDGLLPVHLRAGGRSLGGALSWNEPAALGPFPDSSPFKDLAVPDDVTIRTQVLAEPSPDLAAKTWAKLSDGTPLITAERRGQGWVVLFHVTATPEWSGLPLSGLFVDLLRRMIDISAGVAGDPNASLEGTLPPISLLDGFGHLTQPGPTATPVAAATLSTAKAGPETPPGLYGAPGNAVALNLSSQLTGLQTLHDVPPHAQRLNFEGLSRERALKPWLLCVALALLIVDLIVSFVLRGLMPEISVRTVRSTAGMVAFLALLLIPNAGRAAEIKPTAPIDPATTAAILQTRLAYVVTGRADVDHVCDAGLRTLTRVLAGRTSAELAQPAAIDLNAGQISADTLIPYPVLYWRITPEQARPNAKAAAALSAYLHRGGMVVFDAPDQAGAIGGHGTGAKLDEILRSIDVPPLVMMPNDHVVMRSFYLLRGLPGRFADAPVYVEKGSSANDGVSSVIIGGNDWVSAWARDDVGLPLFAVVPGGESQREMALRAGVNMVMYALTGNYKSDQVHLPAIMQRLTQ